MHSAHSTFCFSEIIQKGKAADLPLRTCAKFILIKQSLQQIASYLHLICGRQMTRELTLFINQLI